MDEPPVRLFMMGQNAWRDEHEWPLARTQYTTYYLHSAGAANTPAGDGLLTLQAPADEPADQYLYDPRDPVMSLYLPNAQPGPCDARLLDDRADMLVYQTPSLERDTEVTGPIEVTLYASTSARDTDWTARLVDVHPDGFAVNLGYGIVRARYRDGWSAPTLVEQNRIYEYVITLIPTSNLFKAGHRIRLDISSSDFPNFERNHNTGEDDWANARFVTAHQRIFHDADHASRVVLPIIP
jgi:putative CocE/NonD family hydrolase